MWMLFGTQCAGVTHEAVSCGGGGGSAVSEQASDEKHLVALLPRSQTLQLQTCSTDTVRVKARSRTI